MQLIWTNRLLETSNLRKAYSEQVKICIEIGLSCVQEDRHKRPTIQDIVDKLNAMETECIYASRNDLSLMCQVRIKSLKICSAPTEHIILMAMNFLSWIQP